jgi:hypothetical protein
MLRAVALAFAAIPAEPRPAAAAPTQGGYDEQFGRRATGTDDSRRLVGDLIPTGGATWIFPDEVYVEFKTNDLIEGANSNNEDKTVTLFAGVEYTSIEIHVPDDYGFVTAGTVAGVPYHASPGLKLVPLGTMRQDCRMTPRRPVSAVSSNGTNAWMGDDPIPLLGAFQDNVDPNMRNGTRATDGNLLYNEQSVKFMHGGLYALCYTPDGTFDESDNDLAYNTLMNMTIEVVGLHSDCTTDDCLGETPWHCYFKFRSSGSEGCKVSFSPVDGRQQWGVHEHKRPDNSETFAISMTHGFGMDAYDDDGKWVSSNPTSCFPQRDMSFPEMGYIGPENPIKNLPRMEVTEDTDYKAHLPQPDLFQADPFTARLCACPDYSNYEYLYFRDYEKYVEYTTAVGSMVHCLALHQYPQPFGRVFFWTMRLCDLRDAVCAQRYVRVLPQQNFLIRLDCPPGQSCAYNSPATNQIKLLRRFAYREETPSWDPEHACKVYSQADDVAIWNTYKLDGGARQDYKLWGVPPLSQSRAQNLLVTPYIRATLGTSLDVCYCDDNCEDPKNFFKVGEVEVTKSFGFAHRSNASDHGLRTLGIVNQPGTITLFAGQNTSMMEDTPNPWDGPAFSRRAIVNIISIDRVKQPYVDGERTLQHHLKLHISEPEDMQTILDAECSKAIYDKRGLVTGPSDLKFAKDFAADIFCEDGGDSCASSRFLPFTGDIGNKETIINKAGVIGICYCGELNQAKECTPAADGRPRWYFAGMMTIRGPWGSVDTPNFDFPTDVVLKIALEGWGFSPNDKLRIIPYSGQCSDYVDKYGGPQGTTKLLTGCPGDCEAATADTNIIGYTLSSEGLIGMDVDEFDQPIQVTARGVQKDIVQIETFVTYSVLTFAPDVEIEIDEFDTGDVIVLNPNKLIIKERTVDEWTADDLYVASKIAGVHRFQHANAGTRYYQSGHRITRLYTDEGKLDKQRISIPAGFPHEEARDNKAWISISTARVVDCRPTHAEPCYQWLRTNKLETKESIVGESPTPTPEGQPFRVCWGSISDETGLVEFHTEAALLQFKEPPAMPQDVAVALTTTQADTAAPAIISFTTGAHYNASMGKTVLRLAFTDMAVFEPRVSMDATPYGTEDSVSSEPQPVWGKNYGSDPPYRDYMQYMCGVFFVEMWTNDDEGFPMPEGCYSTREMDLPPVQRNNLKFIKPHVGIVFRERNALKHLCRVNGELKRCEYMIVFNVKPVSLYVGDHIMDLYTMCLGPKCSKDYNVLEKGRGISESETQVAVVSTKAPRWGISSRDLPNDRHTGFTLLGRSQYTEELDMSNALKFMAELNGDDQNPIQAGAVLRVYMWPLTLWHLETGCSVECIPQEVPALKQCGDGNPLPCDALPVVSSPGGEPRNNMMKIKMPDQMDRITNMVSHTVKVSGLTVPKMGFFPSRLGAQITNDEDVYPMYTTSTYFWYKVPDAEETEARIVQDGQSLYGPKPFVMNEQNAVHIRLRMGSTLWQNGDAGGGAIFLTLPQGMNCHVGEEAFVPDFDRIFLVDKNNDGYLDNNHGRLSKKPFDGSFGGSQTSGNCMYTLQPNQFIPAGTVLYLKIKVDMPFMPVARDDTQNKWYVNLRGKGQDTRAPTAWESGDTEFMSLEKEQSMAGEPWLSNIPTLSELYMPLIQPTDMAMRLPGENIDIYQWVQVFFRTPIFIDIEYEIFNAHIRVHGPEYIDFGSHCKVGTLAPYYYVAQGADGFQTYPLRNVMDCIGTNWDHSSDEINPNINPDLLPTLDTPPYKNRARFQVGMKIYPDRVYGFKIWVKNPAHYKSSTHYGWRIWTEDEFGLGVDGTPSYVLALREQFTRGGTTTTTTTTLDELGNPPPPQPVPHFNAGWGTYDFSLRGLTVWAPDMLPYSIYKGNQRLSTDIVVYPISVPNDLETSMRFTAPFGYIFEDMMIYSSYRPSSNSTTGLINVRPRVPANQVNQLIWDSINLQERYIYGFTAKARIPDQTPVNSSNAFTLELGYLGNDVSIRVASAVVPAARVRAIVNARVIALSNRAGYGNNWLEFNFELITPIPPSGGLIIQGDEYTRNFIFPPNCLEALRLVDDGLPFMDGTQCVYVDEMGIPHLQFQIGINGMPKGTYKFEWEVSNPPDPQPQLGIFSIETYRDITTYPNSDLLDRPAKAIGINLQVRMLDAQLVDLTAEQKAIFSRDDRPMMPNVVICMFQLTNTPVNTQDLVVTAPKGFVFNENCINDIEVDNDRLFGPQTAATWPAEYQKWPAGSYPRKCTGSYNRAAITIPLGLQKNFKYVFRLHLANNGPSTPTHNYWNIGFDNTISDPFDGFPLWSFTDISLVPVSTANSLAEEEDKVGSPVFMDFRPTRTVFSAVFDANAFRRLEAEKLLEGPRDAFGRAVPASGSDRRLQFLPGSSTTSTTTPAPSYDGGSIELRAASGFTFPSKAGCMEPPAKRYKCECRIGISDEPGIIVFLEEDLFCQRLSQEKEALGEASGNGDRFDMIKVFLTGNKALVGGKKYQLSVDVTNPTEVLQPAPWGLRSFSPLGEPLDDVYIPGFVTNPRLNLWTVLNANGPDGSMVTKGNMKVRDLTFTANFPAPLKDGDVLRIESPEGFVIRADGIGNYCNEFFYPFPANSLQNAPLNEPSCKCSLDANDITTCVMEFVVNEGRNPAFPQAVDFIWKLTTTNPKETPPALENFWRIYHFQNGEETAILGSDSAYSWQIRPQIEGLQIHLRGPNKAAMEISSLLVTFMPVMRANTMKLIAVYPTGFDFGNAIVEEPFRNPITNNPEKVCVRDGIVVRQPCKARIVLTKATELNEISIDNLGAVPGQESSVIISNIRLGIGGGQTIFDMQTFNGTAMNVVRDERFNFEEGFRLPGALQIGEKRLNSMYQEDAVNNPVRAIFPPTVEDRARASFTFQVMQSVYARERMTITSFGTDAYNTGAYILMTDGFVLLGRDLIDNALTQESDHQLVAHLGPMYSPNSVMLQALTDYSLSIWVTPRQGQSRWRFETQDDNNQDPTNTNDGLLESFLTVSPVPFELNAILTPPRATVKITLKVDVPQKLMTEDQEATTQNLLGETVSTVEYEEVGTLLVIAPQGFNWVPNCGRICTPSEPLGQTGRETAILRHEDGRSLNAVLMNRVDLLIITPEATPDDMYWFIEAKDKNDQTIGWGENPGFEIQQMPAMITFPSVANLNMAPFAIVFSMSNPNGLEIRVEPPRLYRLQCSGGDVAQMSLPGDQAPTCVSNDPLVLRLNKTMQIGYYSFMVTGSVPETTPLKNTFNLIVSSMDGQVLDSAYNLPAKEIRRIEAHSPTLSWTDSVPGMHTTVQLGFTLTATTTAVKAIVFEFPEKFRQDLPSTNQIANGNPNFPVAAANEWADIEDPTKIRLFLDDTEEDTPIPPGTYTWKFPVVVPKIESFPERVNIWHISLCTSRLCTTYVDASSAVVFPIQGFVINQRHPDYMGGADAFCASIILFPVFALLAELLEPR